MIKFPEKGSFGYFKRKKKMNLTFSILSFAAVLIIFFTGVIIYHNNKSIFTVIATVSVLPAAKILISYLILLPYNSDTREHFLEITSVMSKQPEAVILSDILLASPEKSIIAGTIVINNGDILIYSDHKKAVPATTDAYIKKILESCNYSSVKTYTDYKTFLSHLKSSADAAQIDESQLERVRTTTDRIERTILTYTI